jgi:hypothetical protein
MKAKGWVRQTPPHIAKSAILLIGCAIGANAVAANNMPADCNEVSKAPQDLSLPVTTLVANQAEHVLIPVEDPEENLAENAEVDPQSIAPILSLTPRVLNILDQVFATDELTPETLDTESAESASPVAGSEDSNGDKKESVEENPLIRQEIQSQMYRKDI